MSELLAIGVSFKTAPVEVRERLALTEGRGLHFLHELRAAAEVREVVVVSTCNRTELYLVVGDPVEAESAVLGMLARKAGIRPTALAPAIYSHRNCDAARHLFRVTSGLESMIVGEAEIQGQVKRAYETALERETTGPLTNHLFRAAIATGKRVRTETEIGARQMSLPSVAVTAATRELGTLEGRHVVIVGTGETAELAARAVSPSGCRLTIVSGRRRSRAISLAQRYGGDSVSFDELPVVLPDADVLVSATSSPHLLIEVRELEEVLAERTGRPLIMVDLAVPRDIDPLCGALPGVSLHDVDDLEAVIGRNRRVRQSEAGRAQGIIESEIQSFAAWMGSLEVLPTVAALRRTAQTIADGVVAENAGRWETASEHDLERVDAIAHAIVGRLLHHPTLRMKELIDDHVHARLALVRDLFDLALDDERMLDAPAAAAEDLSEIRRLPERLS